ncbi:N-acetylglucosamine-specific PTS transporter subunit IIBC [Sphingomonas sp.]|uniref:N-acetylglucosamine-specific PTS transporter subunit IIBC n=1 Tax=Sphingomonas sp. TaxID=28214 RepID=UPI003B3AD258
MTRWISTTVERLQPLGRALMLPIAVLPIAALLLRLGQPDMLDIAFVAAAGDAIFSNLGLLFAIGVAIGLARENHGAAGLAGVVCYLVATEGAKPLLSLPPQLAADQAAAAAWQAKEIAKLSVPAGILSGLVSGWLYNRFSTIALPAYLGFFAGRRFVPIVAGLSGCGFALLFGAGSPWFEVAIDSVSRWVVASGPVGLFVYGLLNRLLLVTGLHHIINNIAWFVIGDFHGATGDIKRFFAGDPTAGGFMAGFFPVMMFGLPAACLAMYRTALPERKKAVGGLLLSLALTSFLTGVTEPIEFSFLFLAPLLFLVHAILTGLAMTLMALLGVKLGFGFSAGLFDYVLNYGLATRPLLLLPIGLIYFELYYVTFVWCIRRFDLKTPGRESSDASVQQDAATPLPKAATYLRALGGKANLVTIDACTTRLRLTVRDPAAVDDAALRGAGARGVIRLGSGGIQVVVGPEADQLAQELRGLDTVPVGPEPAASAWSALLQAAEVREVSHRGRRLILACAAPDRVDMSGLTALGVRTSARTAQSLHLILSQDAGPVARQLEAMLAAIA